ncbi:hypothetical protein Kpol_449p5 [Vanderwaltozyma polyspora DSM 70294]|uniref:DUF3533 domain-containing protein n=1 Tax=Vanderwaltozyma polyspora (strain ATCC 22028 / DSM 70294 / BCRC 21397 / CBS 2163 / NBRC 10782 / NRRL Y-8283 / UCD 57-17) TaxID=436907 RepID=A7TR15_VANPO|nr:uncharacterized protein Kpol_449p5 [Vanderwaltozyma polyspora DSM 70294]EDO15290.1 hypothetical protein Kpol_449p5 [Vanderwaltozyma polyspora DSM 70294]
MMNSKDGKNSAVDIQSELYDESNSQNSYIDNEDIADEKNIASDELTTSDGERLQPGPPPRLNFWDNSLKDLRFTICKQLVINLFLLGFMCFTVLCIYWGASYHRDKFIHKVNILAVFQDDDGNSPLSRLAYEILDNYTSTVKGNWKVYNQSEFMNHYHLTDSSQVNQKIFEIIHHEDYWFSLNIKENATRNLISSLTDNNSSNIFDSTEYFEVGYESGRDPTNLKSAILPISQAFQSVYKKLYPATVLSPIINSVNISDTEPEKLISASSMDFTFSDWRPFTDAVILTPLQVGSIYTLILTVVQFALWGKVHGMVSQKLKIPQLIVYRILISVVTLFFLSLFFCTISAIFQVDFTMAFGRGGFVVYWMSTWLVMLAVGGANENVITLIVAYGTEYLAFWLLTWIILNISVTFFPMALDSNFYRYGYAMPIHNAVDIYKVIFLNLSKHKMGRNYGILVAWVVLNWTLLPLFMKISGAKMQKNAKEQMEQSLVLAKKMGRI